MRRHQASLGNVGQECYNENTMSAKPTIEVSKVQSQDHPAWKLLFDQTKDLQAGVKFFKDEHLYELDKKTLLVAQIEKCVVGIIRIQNDTMHYDNAVGVGYVSTHKKYQNMGVATAMVKALFAHAQLEGKAIFNSRYELDGEIYLQPVMERVSNKYPTVELVERDYY